jgi:N-acetylglucosamine kinase-like BadF-type ATPase
MKLDLLKKLIKEAVKEAVREELETILSEDVKPIQAPKQTVTKYAEYKPVVARPVATGDPIADLMNETKYSMTQGEYQNLVSATSDMVQAPGLGMNPIEGFRQGPEPGLDISQFDFVKRAGDVYKASVEKDKQRFGA